jgi:hypothetical protein
MSCQDDALYREDAPLRLFRADASIEIAQTRDEDICALEPLTYEGERLTYQGEPLTARGAWLRRFVDLVLRREDC